jgi:hypothetical protein
VAEEIAHQLQVDVELGQIRGSEAPVDPRELLPGWAPRVSLREGLSQVISEARSYLQKAPATTAVT